MYNRGGEKIMENNIKELEGFEENFFINILASYNTKNSVKMLREKLNEKLEEIRIIKSQIKMLKFESLDLTEEITRLINEIEIKKLDEKYRQY